MKIKTQFIICIAVFSVILLIIAASVANTEQQVAHLSSQEQVSSNIERGVSSLNSVSIDYFLYQENLQVSRWQSVFSSFSSDLSNLKSDGNKQQQLVNTIAADLQRLNESFFEVVSYLQSAPRNVSVRVDPAFQIRWSSMAVQSQTLAFDASQLSGSLNDQTHQVNQTNVVLIVSFVATFGAFLAAIYLMVFRRTLKSVTDLQKGIKTIGSGNLDYVIETKRDDEIAELSHSFNQMTTSLKTITASKTDLEHAQILLRESEQRWATTLASIGDAVIATDVSGQVRFMNGVAEGLTGWTLSEALLKPVTEVFNIINEETRMVVEDPVSKVLENGMIVGLANHTVLVRKDGSDVPIDDSGAPIKDKDGKTTGVVLIFRDITERKKAEEATKRQAGLIDLSPDAIMVRTLEGAITFWSKGAEELYGWKSSEANGKTSHALMETVFPEPLNGIVSQVKKDGQWSGELRHKTKDGRDVIVQSWWLAEKNEQGEIKDILESNIDITERKQIEAKLKEYTRNLERLVEERTKKLELSSLYARSLIEASLDPLVTISAEGKITDVNKATELTTGYSREQLIGSDFSNYFTEPEKAKTGYKRVFTQGYVTDYPLAVKHMSGKITYVLYNATVYRNEAGEIQGVFAAARDVTERKQAEAQAQEASKKLKDSERLAAIGATAGMVGHDIRNPLQAITSDVYLAKTDLASIPESEERNSALESLQEIQDNVEYINKIVADLQDYARILKPVPKETDLEKLVEETLKKNVTPKNVKVHVKMQKEANTVIADSDILKRILGNLVTNAIQAMPEGGKLSISTSRKADDIVISVQDTGVGIPEDVRGKLFQPLFTTKSKGQGFGLAVVKRMTEALGGTVTFESEEGKGTKFSISLPPQQNKD
jgi:PAS domain S-box-containing protein